MGFLNPRSTRSVSIDFQFYPNLWELKSSDTPRFYHGYIMLYHAIPICSPLLVGAVTVDRSLWRWFIAIPSKNIKRPKNMGAQMTQANQGWHNGLWNTSWEGMTYVFLLDIYYVRLLMPVKYLAENQRCGKTVLFVVHIIGKRWWNTTAGEEKLSDEVSEKSYIMLDYANMARRKRKQDIGMLGIREILYYVGLCKHGQEEAEARYRNVGNHKLSYHIKKLG